jgi:glycerol kinase
MSNGAASADTDAWAIWQDNDLDARSAIAHTEALVKGIAYVGVWSGTDELAAQWQVERTFHPTMPRARAAGLMQQWEHAVAQATA